MSYILDLLLQLSLVVAVVVFFAFIFKLIEIIKRATIKPIMGYLRRKLDANSKKKVCTQMTIGNLKITKKTETTTTVTNGMAFKDAKTGEVKVYIGPVRDRPDVKHPYAFFVKGGKETVRHSQDYINANLTRLASADWTQYYS